MNKQKSSKCSRLLTIALPLVILYTVNKQEQRIEFHLRELTNVMREGNFIRKREVARHLLFSNSKLNRRMTNIPEVYLLQATKKNMEQAKAFQEDMGAHFFEHTMYDVKDALTSILALCDMEDMKQVPQVKKYIQRVTDLLQDVGFYRSSSLFNVNHVVINVINVLKSNYKAKVHIAHDLSFIKAFVKSDKSHLEQILLYSLIEAVEASPEALNLKIELAQKEHDAVITIRLKDFIYSSVALREIQSFHDSVAFRMQIITQGQGTEMVIRLPLSFDVRESEASMSEGSSVIKLSNMKVAKEKKVTTH